MKLYNQLCLYRFYSVLYPLLQIFSFQMTNYVNYKNVKVFHNFVKNYEKICK